MQMTLEGKPRKFNLIFVTSEQMDDIEENIEG